MSTRSCIIVKIKKEDLGKVMKFNESLVRGLESWEKNESKEGYFPEITLKYQYLSVYCHWDGYLEGVGAELKEHYNTYEKALNLVLGGSISSINIPSSVQMIGSEAFTFCYNITQFSVESDNPVYATIDGVLYNKKE